MDADYTKWTLDDLKNVMRSEKVFCEDLNHMEFLGMRSEKVAVFHVGGYDEWDDMPVTGRVLVTETKDGFISHWE